MPVDKLRALPPFGNDPFQVVAERVRPLGYLLKDTLYHAFLRFFTDLVAERVDRACSMVFVYSIIEGITGWGCVGVHRDEK